MHERIRNPRTAVFLAAMALLAGVPAFAVPTSSATFNAPSTPNLRINEVLASNTRISNGSTFPDMIELFNAGSTAVDLSGKRLADATASTPFVFPNGTTIAAGGYLVVFADSATASPGLHTGFSLDAEGDEVRLLESTANGGGVMDSIKFGFQVPDFSISRTGAGANVWTLTAPTMTSTAGAANGTPVTVGSVATMKINEWAGNIVFRLDHDMIELYNPATTPVGLGGVRLTDDIGPGKGYTFPALSFMPASGFLPMYKGDYLFGLNGDRAIVTLLGDNNEQIDQITLIAQPDDRSSGRSPDGAATIVTFNVPTPGISNTTPLPAGYQALMDNLRITEVMYQPAAPSGSSDYEFIELQNIGTTTLSLGGVRFTNGIEHTFAAGETLAPGAFMVLVNDRSSFLSRYPGLTPIMAQGGFNGSLNNDGDTLALTLPAPWKVHILRFRYDNNWFASASGGGRSLVIPTPSTTPAANWGQRTAWRASAAINGSPGAADAGAADTPGGGGGGTVAAKLSNLSVRTAMAAGQTLIVGVVVSGGSRDVLVRAVGPALTAFGLAGAMTDPRLELYNGTSLEFENNDWPSTLGGTFASVGAFPLTAGSRDAAFVRTWDGARSVQARGTGAGVVLVEAYDTGGTSAARMVNVSARNRVGTGDDILIAGFNVAGTGAKQLLIRAIGPTLTTFGVTGVLNDPKLEIYNGSVKVSENDNWAASLAATFTAVGAFQLGANSRDAALITTLNPGSYTVQVSGADGGTGEGLIEIYEVP